MGFLQHDTNNIILDAVLTDTGRSFLARNDGSFSLIKYALGDDEVDYTIIAKFGRTVGKEKIEKNTPVFEALTNQNHAQKYRLVSISNPNLIRLPTLNLQGTSVESGILKIGNNTTESITIEQTITNENVIDVELRDQTFIVEMNNLFLQLPPPNVFDNLDSSRTAKYLMVRNATPNAKGGSVLNFNMQSKNIPATLFDIWGGSNKNLISTFVKITGLQSGAVKEFEVQISK